MTEADLGKIKATLEEHLKALRERRGTITKAPERGSGVSFGKRVGDGTTEAVSRLTDVGVVDTLNATEDGSSARPRSPRGAATGSATAVASRSRPRAWRRRRRACSASSARAPPHGARHGRSGAVAQA